MSKLIGVDTYLGPEMKSTGEVMGIDRTFEAALAKALIAADMALPPKGASSSASPTARSPRRSPRERRSRRRLPPLATEGTAAMIRALGIPVEQITKRLDEGHPNVVDVIHDGIVDAVINTPEGRVTETLRDGFHIRRAAAEKRIPCFTSIDTARAAISSLVRKETEFTIQPLRDYLTVRE